MALLLVLVLFQPPLLAQAKKDDAFSKYLKKMKSSPTNIIDLTDDMFRTMVYNNAHEREYTAIVMFTAEGQQYGCVQCRYTFETLSQVANSYLLQRFSHHDNPLVFAKANVAKAPQVFQMLQLQTVPHVYIFKKKTPMPSSYPPSDDLEVGWHANDPADICDNIMELTGIAITPIPDTNTTVWVGIIIAALLGILGHLVTAHWEGVKAFPWSRKLWMLVSLTVYGGGIGGMVYCVIRKTPWWSFNREGSLTLFLERGQDQLVSEGLIVAAVHLLFVASLLLGYKSASRNRNVLIQYLGVMVSLALSVFFLQKIFMLYMSKTRWYRLHDTMPDTLQEAIFGPVRKNSGILKRLERASYIFLYEFKGWANFRKKCEQIFVAYFKRSLGLPEK